MHKSITDGIKCVVEINVHGQLNEYSSSWQDKDQAVSRAASNLANILNACKNEALKVMPEANHADNIDLDSGKIPSIKTLSTVWNSKEDLVTHK